MRQLSDELQVFGYASETLINGNISECIRYIELLYSKNLNTWAHEELTLIKENCPERYNYILKKVH